MSSRLLIVEDNAANLKLMSYLLRSFGHDVLTADDGDVGLAIAAREALDLIICDIQMPGLDGYDVAHRLKADQRLARIPLIAVTALAMVGDRDRVLAAGFDGYITKPLVPRTFVNQIEAYLGPQRTRPHAQSPTGANLADAGVKKGIVLVVDDAPVNIKLGHKLLEPFGYEVLGAATVQEAMAITRARMPDLILSDLHPCRESGFDLIRMVKADPLLRGILYIFISSTTPNEKERDHGLALGAHRFLVRPISPQRLLAEIEACLKQNKEQ